MGLRISFEVLGVKQTKAGLAKAGPRSQADLGRSLRKSGEIIRSKSLRLVPVDTGRLAGTAFVRGPRGLSRPEVRVGYGTNYAVFVHERLDVRHKSPRKAKFLEIPARAVMGKYETNVTRSNDFGFFDGLFARFL